MFHRILPEKQITHPNAYSTFGTLISQEYFEQILSFLTIRGFQFVSISQLLESSESENQIALTFDDGYADNFQFAVPSLVKYGANATFYPVVQPCRDNSVLPLDIYYQCVDKLVNLSEKQRTEYISGAIKKHFYWAEPEEQLAIIKRHFQTTPTEFNVSYMDSQQLKKIAEKGFEIGSHGLTHSIFTADYMNEDKILLEYEKSKIWLESVTGIPVRSFCFPAGRYTGKMIVLAKQKEFTSVCLVKRSGNEIDILPSFERIFVKPNSFGELLLAINDK